jgi:hypothetical protein
VKISYFLFGTVSYVDGVWCNDQRQGKFHICLEFSIVFSERQQLTHFGFELVSSAHERALCPFLNTLAFQRRTRRVINSSSLKQLRPTNELGEFLNRIAPAHFLLSAHKSTLILRELVHPPLPTNI